MATTTATKVQFIPCSDECMYAKGDECNCECQGHNHQVGTNGLIPAQYMEKTYTVAGRLINPVFKDSAQESLAWLFISLHEAGTTKRDIAKQFGVSGPTVRRYITRALLGDEQDSE